MLWWQGPQHPRAASADGCSGSEGGEAAAGEEAGPAATAGKAIAGEKAAAGVAGAAEEAAAGYAAATGAAAASGEDAEVRRQQARHELSSHSTRLCCTKHAHLVEHVLVAWPNRTLRLVDRRLTGWGCNTVLCARKKRGLGA